MASAGSHPKPLHTNTARVLRNNGIGLTGRAPQHLSAVERERFDYVITLCDKVREVCPQVPGHAEQLHWSIPDPAASGGTGQDTYPAFERMAAELETRIGFLVAAIGAAFPQAPCSMGTNVVPWRSGGRICGTFRRRGRIERGCPSGHHNGARNATAHLAEAP